MQIITTIREMRKLRGTMSGSIGFIPTMGYLHEGHLSLVEQAKKENEHVVVSIFVNPKQFGPNEDFSRYPRDEQRDTELLKKAGVDVLFLPTVDEIYPEGFDTYVIVENISQVLEGEKRPGHFKGVATVVTKLFNIIQPDNAYFGQKDAQQVSVMKKMVTDLQFPIKIVVGITIREPNGLAKSSRNVYLTESEQKEAAVLFRSLQLALEKFQKGEKDSIKIKKEMKKLIQTTSGSIDYISIVDPETLKELDIIKKDTLISLAVYFGKTRLIDNIILH
jgi:pantoate--beta-alanine ligase